MEKQLVGYQYLLTYRYHNLCVKAEPMALLSVIVRMDGEEQEIEQVADVVVPDEYHFQILPKMTNSLEEINMGILTVHPEFEPSFELMDPENPDTEYLIYKMPDVDKERRDMLMEAAKVLTMSVKCAWKRSVPTKSQTLENSSPTILRTSTRPHKPSTISARSILTISTS